MNSFVFIIVYLQVITNAARLYTGPSVGISMHLHTKNKRERESSQWSISAQKTIFFFYLRLKTLTWHPLSGNEMIEYCYCKTRPLKILTVCSRDAPEQDKSLVERPLTDTVVHFLTFLFNSAAFTRHREPGVTHVWLNNQGFQNRSVSSASGSLIFLITSLSSFCGDWGAILWPLLPLKQIELSNQNTSTPSGTFRYCIRLLKCWFLNHQSRKRHTFTHCI